MRGPKPPMLQLADAERQELERLVRRHTTPQQLALRAKIVLAAADGANNCQIARLLDVSLDMARRWRQRWLVLQPASLEDLPIIDRLTDAPRPGKPVHITAEQVTQPVFRRWNGSIRDCPWHWARWNDANSSTSGMVRVRAS